MAAFVGQAIGALSGLLALIVPRLVWQRKHSALRDRFSKLFLPRVQAR
jgi:hypothetical protein